MGKEEKAKWIAELTEFDLECEKIYKDHVFEANDWVSLALKSAHAGIRESSKWQKRGYLFKNIFNSPVEEKSVYDIKHSKIINKKVYPVKFIPLQWFRISDEFASFIEYEYCAFSDQEKIQAMLLETEDGKFWGFPKGKKTRRHFRTKLFKSFVNYILGK